MIVSKIEAAVYIWDTTCCHESVLVKFSKVIFSQNLGWAFSKHKKLDETKTLQKR